MNSTNGGGSAGLDRLMDDLEKCFSLHLEYNMAGEGEVWFDRDQARPLIQDYIDRVIVGKS